MHAHTGLLPLLGFEPGGAVAGEFRPPGSKSIAQRLVVAASLGHEEFRITALPDGADVLAALAVARTVARDVRTLAPAAVAITGNPPGPHRGWAPSVPLAVGESGTLARLALAALALCGRGGALYTLAPSGTLVRRASPALVRALAESGVDLEALAGGDASATFALRVRPIGPPAELVLRAPRSSQEVSALLVALAAYPDTNRLVVEGAIPSRPYLDLTLGVLARLGVSVVESVAGDTRAHFDVRGPLRAPAEPIVCEPDASSAAVALCAACMSGGALVIRGLGDASLQGDVRIVEHLARFGCDTSRDADTLRARGVPRHGAELDLAREPDLAPALAAVAAAVALAGRGASRFAGLETLPGKESSRIAVLATGLAALGLDVAHDARSLRIAPGAPTRGPLVLDPAGDHRMAFAFGLAGLVRPGVRVSGADCVAKSWPGFWRDLARLGARLASGHADATPPA